MTLRVHKARDFAALVRKLYSAHGLIRTGITHLPGTLAERHAVQRLYTITRSPTAFVATPKDDALAEREAAERDRQPQPGDVFSFKDGWKCGS